MKSIFFVLGVVAAAVLGGSLHVQANSGGFATGLSNAGLNAFRDAVLPVVNQELAAFNVSQNSLLVIYRGALRAQF